MGVLAALKRSWSNHKMPPCSKHCHHLFETPSTCDSMKNEEIIFRLKTQINQKGHVHDPRAQSIHIQGIQYSVRHFDGINVLLRAKNIPVICGKLHGTEMYLCFRPSRRRNGHKNLFVIAKPTDIHVHEPSFNDSVGVLVSCVQVYSLESPCSWSRTRT